MLSLALDPETDSAQLVVDRLGPEHFASDDRAAIFGAIGRIVESGGRPTYGEVLIRLEREQVLRPTVTQELDAIGDVLGHPANLPGWMQMLDELRRLRAAWRAAQMLQQDKPAAEVLADFERALLQAEPSRQEIKVYSGPEIEARILKRLQERSEKPAEVRGLKTGIHALTETVGGVAPGDLWVLSGPTGEGKSLFASLVISALLKQQASCLYVNTEMNADRVEDRLVAIHAGVEIRSITTGLFQKGEFEAARTAAQEIGRSGLHITESIMDLAASRLYGLARRYQRQQRVQVLILDYVGAMSLGVSGRSLEEYQVLGEIAKTLKKLASELQITVLMVAQLNAEGQLAGSKRMEHWADLHTRLDPFDPSDNREREAAERLGYDRESPTGYRVTHWLTCAKVRNGPKGARIPLQRHPKTLRFSQVVQP